MLVRIDIRRVAFRHGYLPHIVFTYFGIGLCHTLP
jgi:hypothetical protein